MATFTCWQEDESPDNGIEVQARRADVAAEEYARDWYAEIGDDDSLSVCVRSEDGTVRIFDVDIEVEIDVLAFERRVAATPEAT